MNRYAALILASSLAGGAVAPRGGGAGAVVKDFAVERAREILKIRKEKKKKDAEKDEIAISEDLGKPDNAIDRPDGNGNEETAVVTRPTEAAEHKPRPVIDKRPVNARPKRQPVEVSDYGPLEMVDAVIPDYVPRQVLYFSAQKPDALRRIAADSGISIIEIDLLDQIGLSMVTAQLKTGDTVPAALVRLEKQAGINWAQPNHYFQLLGNSRSKGYALHGIKEDQVAAQTGSIVMIDSAVDVSNPAFADAKIEQRLFGISNIPGAHGTAIAELLVGTGDFAGVAKGAKLVSLAAFEPGKGKTALSQSRYLAKALNEASRLRPNVANLSFGAKATDRILAFLLDKMEQRGICVVSAAGNGNGGKVLFPGRYRTTLSVTALDAGKHVYQYASKGPEIDTAAWGVDMNAAVPGGRRSVSGTSFATAIVSGSLLRMPFCNGGNDPKTMRKMVSEYAQDLGDPGRDEIFGAGMFRLEKAATGADPVIAAADNGEMAESKWQSLATLIAAISSTIALLLFFIWRRKKKAAAELS